jgi:hypothetical protein
MRLLVPRYDWGAVAAAEETMTSSLLGQIPQSGHHQGLDAGGQHRLNDRREVLRLIDRDVLLHPAGLERSLALLWVRPTDPSIRVGRA